MLSDLKMGIGGWACAVMACKIMTTNVFLMSLFLSTDLFLIMLLIFVVWTGFLTVYPGKAQAKFFEVSV